MNILLFILFICINIGIAWLNNQVVLKRLSTHNNKQIEHFWYGLGYVLLCSIPFLWKSDINTFLSLLALHGSVFPVAYNAFKGDEIFHLSETTSSLFDRAQIKLGFKTSTFVNTLCLLISITLMFL